MKYTQENSFKNMLATCRGENLTHWFKKYNDLKSRDCYTELSNLVMNNCLKVRVWVESGLKGQP